MVDSAQTATRWLFPIYTNELNWMFCWSYVMVEKSLYEPSALKTGDKLKMIRQSKLEDIYNTPLTQRKKYVFYVAMTVMTLLRLGLNFSGLWMLTSALSNIAPRDSKDYTDMTNLPYMYTTYTFDQLSESREAWISGIIFATSTVIHFLMYAIHRFHIIKLTTNDASDGDWGYVYFWFAHVGLLNWLFDIPGINVPTVKFPHVIVILLNLTALLIFICTIYFEKPIITAWGCYAPGTSILDLKYGVCPAFINDPFQPDTPVCDQPGVRCGEGAVRWHHILNTTIVRSFVISSLSFIIYFISISAKIDYYSLSNRLVMQTSNKRV